MLTLPVDGLIKQEVAAYNAVSGSDTAFFIFRALLQYEQPYTLFK
ncbi:Uncharacterised protein [Sphingobacterium spiritivorum]|uniref:Uncharacterized protein n=1 Tax=Sphingobacterium spiritivorum TaxID=258 RepID=A0A380BKP4_SPHSI|nr:Uncharacterised protein [Sphingobacterium spiritivorum]